MEPQAGLWSISLSGDRPLPLLQRIIGQADCEMRELVHNLPIEAVPQLLQKQSGKKYYGKSTCD